MRSRVRGFAGAAAMVTLLGATLGGCGGQRPEAGGRAAAARRTAASRRAAASRRTEARRVELQPLPVASGAVLGPQPPATLLRGALPGVGVTQRVRTAGAALAVTLRQVIDPLRGSGAELPPGSRAVAVVMQISSSGPAVYDSSATGDIRLVASSGVVTPALATRGACRTPRQDFDRYITAGEDRVGCVVFAVADGATLDAVRFAPHAHRAGALTWAP